MFINRIKVLGLLGLPLLAIAVAVMVFAIGNSTNTTQADDFTPAMSLSVDGSQTFPCDGGEVAGKVCVPLNAKFDVNIVADGIPTDGYVLAQGWIKYGPATSGADLVYKPILTGDPPPLDTTTKAIWPDAVIVTNIADLGAPNYTAAGGGTTGAIAPPASFYKGALFSFSMNCTAGQSSTFLDLLPSGDPEAGTSGALFTAADAASTQVVPAVTGLTVNCNPGPTSTPTATPPPIPKMSKCDQTDNNEDGFKDSDTLNSAGDEVIASNCVSLVNQFLTRQSSKIPSISCLAAPGVTGLDAAGEPIFGDTNFVRLGEKLSQGIVSQDPKEEEGIFQKLGAFEFEVHYDATKVCVVITAGTQFTGDEENPGPGICVVEDSLTKPALEGVARIGCVTVKKGHDLDELVPLALVDVYPQPEIYSQAKPNQDNGVVVQINNVGCDLGDEQGHAIPIFSCDDADITFRYLEGDVEPDCAIDATDAQAIAFRWGVEKGSLIYKDFMNLEPSSQQADNDIDINDLQFVFGRFGSTCKDPHPDQDAVNPKA